VIATLGIVVVIVALGVLAGTLILLRREAYGDHVSEGWRDEHFRERRDDA